MLFVWILIGVINFYFAIIQLGTWQSLISLGFGALSIYYIIQHMRRRA